MNDFGEELVDNDEILNILKEIKIFFKEDKQNDSIQDLKKDYPDNIKELEDALLNYMGENDLKLLKTEFPDKWKYLAEKLAYPYEYFTCIDDYQKSVDNLNKEDFFSNLKKLLS